MAPSPTPFDLVFSALWALAEASVPLQSLVPIGDRIKYNQNNRDPIKESVAAGDLPELILLVDGAQPVNINNTSSSSMVTRQFTWMLSTGDMRTSYLLFPVEWALYCAMAGWESVITALQWGPNNYKFAKRLAVTEASAGLSDPSANRGIKGWSALWRCEVEMHFPTADLLSFNTGS